MGPLGLGLFTATANHTVSFRANYWSLHGGALQHYYKRNQSTEHSLYRKKEGEFPGCGGTVLHGFQYRVNACYLLLRHSSPVFSKRYNCHCQLDLCDEALGRRWPSTETTSCNTYSREDCQKPFVAVCPGKLVDNFFMKMAHQGFSDWNQADDWCVGQQVSAANVSLRV